LRKSTNQRAKLFNLSEHAFFKFMDSNILVVFMKEKEVKLEIYREEREERECVFMERERERERERDVFY